LRADPPAIAVPSFAMNRVRATNLDDKVEKAGAGHREEI